jgi:ribosome-binding factor A
VDLSPDYRNARVYYTTPGAQPSPDVERALARAERFLRARLLEALAVKHAPALRMVFDRDGAAAAATALEDTGDPWSR